MKYVGIQKNTGKIKYIGKRKYINDCFYMASIYEQQAMKDEQAAKLLFLHESYNEAVFLYIQSMEKNIKAQICQRINITQSYFSDRLRKMGHSLDDSILFLIEVVSENDEILKEQLTKQILSDVFQDIQFSFLYNNVRYPLYNPKTESYSVLEISSFDCQRIQEIHDCLKRFLKSLYKIK